MSFAMNYYQQKKPDDDSRPAQFFLKTPNKIYDIVSSCSFCLTLRKMGLRL